jgi:hypothetical protein
MESGDIDTVKSTVMSNPIGTDKGKNNILMKDHVFYPILELSEQTPWE